MAHQGVRREGERKKEDHRAAENHDRGVWGENGVVMVVTELGVLLRWWIQWVYYDPIIQLYVKSNWPDR